MSQYVYLNTLYSYAKEKFDFVKVLMEFRLEVGYFDLGVTVQTEIINM